MGAFVGGAIGGFFGAQLAGVVGLFLGLLVGAIVGFLIDAGSLFRGLGKASVESGSGLAEKREMRPLETAEDPDDSDGLDESPDPEQSEGPDTPNEADKAQRDRWQKRLGKIRSGSLKDYTVAQAEDVLHGIDYTRRWMETQGGFPTVVLEQDDEVFYRKLRAVWEATYKDAEQGDPLPIFLERLGVFAQFRRIFHHHICPSCRRTIACPLARSVESCPSDDYSCSVCRTTSNLPAFPPNTDEWCRDLLCGHPQRHHKDGACTQCSCPEFRPTDPPLYQARAEAYKRQLKGLQGGGES